MAADGLIDTSAILALLNREERSHLACVHALRQLPIPLVTSEAVLTEVFHMAGRHRIRLESVWKFIRSGAFTVATIHNHELPAIQALMERYRDLPMDFADATLVYLGQRERRSAILTIDRRDFETYRLEGRKRFRIYPAP